MKSRGDGPVIIYRSNCKWFSRNWSETDRAGPLERNQRRKINPKNKCAVRQPSLYLAARLLHLVNSMHAIRSGFGIASSRASRK